MAPLASVVALAMFRLPPPLAMVKLTVRPACAGVTVALMATAPPGSNARLRRIDIQPGRGERAGDHLVAVHGHRHRVVRPRGGAAPAGEHPAGIGGGGGGDHGAVEIASLLRVEGDDAAAHRRRNDDVGIGVKVAVMIVSLSSVMAMGLVVLTTSPHPTGEGPACVRGGRDGYDRAREVGAGRRRDCAVAHRAHHQRLGRDRGAGGGDIGERLGRLVASQIRRHHQRLVDARLVEDEERRPGWAVERCRSRWCCSDPA